GLQKKLSTSGRNTENLQDYVLKGPAAKAFQTPNAVLLIDEIDKAPREFPNDLLYALSHRKFVMPESGEVIEVSEENMPAIIITSNREQELPTAFKGRCVYHYIAFPEPEIMHDIVEKHFPNMNQDLQDRCISLFYQMRSIGLERAPATRELLSWIKYLKSFETAEALTRVKRVEGMGVLIKNQNDMEKIKSRLRN
ncbi:MAG TPA: MoxR family ATPase, partial [Phaeodactylibacter sp.]|nr:MoxR family ATPase [Phaeodactylibacter sp.]